MSLIPYITFKLETAIEMMNEGEGWDEVACYLTDFKKSLLGQAVIVDEDKTKYLELQTSSKIFQKQKGVWPSHGRDRDVHPKAGSLTGFSAVNNKAYRKAGR